MEEEKEKEREEGEGKGEGALAVGEAEKESSYNNMLPKKDGNFGPCRPTAMRTTRQAPKAQAEMRPSNRIPQ